MKYSVVTSYGKMVSISEFPPDYYIIYIDGSYVEGEKLIPQNSCF